MFRDKDNVQAVIAVKISKFGLKEKIIFAMLSAGLLPLIGYGVISSYLTSKAMQESAYAQMSSLRDVKQEQIQDYIEDSASDNWATLIAWPNPEWKADHGVDIAESA